ncbi:MAG: hypothetical protein JSW58_08000 [Candidatus Latescibacterota bacterium]|nr:MAG: hypothetical protein JSW58_08000 [Candidatus Latescibacterota bacterium]
MARRFQKSGVSSKEEIPIGKRSRILSLPVLGLILVGCVASGLLDVLPAFVRFVCVFLLFSYLPGEMFLQRAMPGRWHAMEVRLPLAVLGGLSFFSVISWVCWLAGVSFRSYLIVLEFTAALLFGALLIWDTRRGAEKTPARPDGSGRRVRGTVYLILALCVSCFWLFSPPVLNYQGDAFVHVGYLRSTIDDNSLDPEEVLAPNELEKTETLKSDPRRGVLHLLLAACSTLSSVEPVALWRWLPVLLSPIAVLSFIAFASMLLPGAMYVGFTVVLFLMFQGGMGREFFGTIGYGQHLSLVFFWILFVVCLRFCESRRVLDLATAMLLLTGGALIHIDVAIHFALMGLSFLLFYRVFGFTTGSLVKLGLSSLVCVSVVLIWKIMTSYQGGNLIHSHAQGLLYFFEIGDNHFVPSPAEVIRTNGLLFFAGLIMIPFLLLIRSHKRFARMNLALCVPPVLVAFNPWVAPLVYAKASYLLHRFLLNIPALVITTLVLGCLISWGRAGGILKKVAVVVVVFLWARLFLLGVTVWMADVRSIRFGAAPPLFSSKFSSVVDFVNKRIPKGSVVLSDAGTSYALGGFTHARVVAVLGQHGNPNDRFAIERLEAIQTVLSPYANQIEAMMAIRKFGVDYVLLNGSIKKSVRGFMAEWDPTSMPVLKKKFGTLRQSFKPIYEEDEIVIYEVVGTDISRVTWDPVVPFVVDIPTDLDRCEVRPVDVPVVVIGIRIDPPVALPGEKVEITVAYRMAGGESVRLPLGLHIRLEDKSYFDETKRYPGDKYVRRYRERRDAAFRRFRFDHRLFRGLYPPHLWPWEAECYERFTVRLPTDLLETVYEVQCKISEEPLVPNFSFWDFVSNEDSYVGTPCTELRIQRQVIR